MKRSLRNTCMARLGAVLAVSVLALPNALAQPNPGPRDLPEEARQAERQAKLQRIANDKAGHAAAIVQRWEADARTSGKWDENTPTDLQNALMKLDPEKLLVADEVPSYAALLGLLATGRPVALAPPNHGAAISPDAIGDTTDDLVFTPVAPCRIVDTRLAGGAIVAGTTRSFDVDNTVSFAFQGGNNGPCGIPSGVARAVAMTITVTQPSAAGYFTAWAVFAAQPLASCLNFVAGETIANTTVVPVLPGGGNDFNVFSGNATAHAVIDVVGYYAAPVATPLQCTTVTSAVVACPYNSWTNVDAFCPSGYSPTGGGYSTPEGSLGYPNVWLFSIPLANGWRTWVDNQNSNGSRNMQTVVNCCRIPGR